MPFDVSPAWLRPVGFSMFITYGLELMRRSFIGEVAEAFPTLANFSNGQLLDILLAMTILFFIIAVLVFRWCNHVEREHGMIDRTTNY